MCLIEVLNFLILYSFFPYSKLARYAFAQLEINSRKFWIIFPTLFSLCIFFLLWRLLPNKAFFFYYVLLISLCIQHTHYINIHICFSHFPHSLHQFIPCWCILQSSSTWHSSLTYFSVFCIPLFNPSIEFSISKTRCFIPISPTEPSPKQLAATSCFQYPLLSLSE